MNETITHLLDRAADAWAAWMIGMSWQVSVVVLCAALLTWLLRRRSAALRYGIWSLVLLRLVIPPGFALPTGWGWWVGPAIDQQVARLSWDSEGAAPRRNDFASANDSSIDGIHRPTVRGSRRRRSQAASTLR